MPSNTIGLLPKKYDTPNEKVRKTSGYLDYIEILVERIPPFPIENQHTVLICIKVSNYLLFSHSIFANH